MSTAGASGATAVAIFVKTPGLSPVKTRLAAGIGQHAATAFHTMAAAAIGAAVAESGLAGYWSVAEAHAPGWADKPLIWQGEGGLGARMGRVYDALLRRHGSVLLVGADSPQTTPALLRQAAAALVHDPYVIGPARDGGFWLFGGRQPVPDAAWQSVAYSTPDTCRQFLAALPPGPVARLAEQLDADHPEDLPALLAALDQLTGANPQQQALATWLQARLQA